MTENTVPLELMGMPGSPYTRKMLALLRYRNIPYRLEFQPRHLSGEAEQSGQRPRHKERPRAKVPLLPTFYLPDEHGGEQVAVTDSTPLIRRFENEYPNQRSVLPPDAALRFVDALIEDYADEWLTKAMFHYRWSYQPDIAKAGAILPRWGNIDVPDEQIHPLSEFISQRQIDRLSYVGSNDITRPTIEQSFQRFVRLLDAHLTGSPFVLGGRPGSADFAIYGQLTCLALFDPTPAAIVLEAAPRVYAWVEMLEDLSGYLCYDDDWLDVAAMPDTLRALLGEIGRVYVPYLLANAKAVLDGAEQMSAELDGRPWQQSPFPYHLKCLKSLREQHAALADADRARLDAALAGTGIEALFASQ